MRDLSTKIVDQFKRKFWYEPKTNYTEAKNWIKYEELEIDLLFKKLRSEYLPVFEQLKYFELMKDIMAAIDFQNKETISEEERIKIVDEYLKDKNKFEILLKQGDILSLKKKFERGISDILEDAKRRRQGFQMNMPYWFYILLIFFGYDDVSGFQPEFPGPDEPYAGLSGRGFRTGIAEGPEALLPGGLAYRPG